ncbi:MAG: T9SS type A sorting domain-containing protein [Bacteroidia bacterium]
MKKLSILLALMAVTVGLMAQLPATVGPDTYGYSGESFDDTDSRYTFIDITQIGTQVTGLSDDNFVGPFNLGFDFQFYWLGRDRIFIGSNGYLAFERGYNVASQAGGFPVTPNAADQKNEMIAAFLSDLSFSTPAGSAPNPATCYFYTNNTDLAVVSFIDVPFWVTAAEDPNQYAGATTFQIQMRKNDSSITILYDKQEGRYSNNYDPQTPNPDPAPLVIGIENVSGTFGLGLSDVFPTAKTGIQFNAPSVAGITIPDVEVNDIQNDESAGFFLPINGADFYVGGTLFNVGNADIKNKVTIDARVDQGPNILYVSDVEFDSLNQATNEPFFFPSPLILTSPGAYEFQVDVTNNEDVNPTNDEKIIEINALDTAGGRSVFDYTQIVDREGVDAQALWTGGMGQSGVGVYIEPFGYPTTFDAAEVFVFPNPFIDVNGNPTNNDLTPDGDIRITVHQSDPAGGIPGNLLLLDTTIAAADLDIEGPLGTGGGTLLGDWNRVDFPSPVTVNSGGLYVAWYHYNDSVILGGETLAPISRRCYEILDGVWAPHRSRNTEDFGIRLLGDVSNVLISGVEEPKELTTFDVYPNPAEGIVNLDLTFSNPTSTTIRVINMAGMKVHYSAHPAATVVNETIDLRHAAKGIYFLQVETPSGIQTKKIAIK